MFEGPIRSNQARPTIESWRDRLVEEHLPLARTLVRSIGRRIPAWEDRGELLSAAYLGLVEASRRFDASRGQTFSSFARLRVMGAILDQLRSNDRLTRRARRRQKRAESVRRRLRSDSGREPEAAEMAAELGVSEREFHELFEQPPVMEFSLDLLERGAAADLQEHQQPDVAGQVARKRLHRRLARAIEQLPERERTVITLVYAENLKYKQIARLLDVTESRICQIHRQACRRLRSSLDGDEVHHQPTFT